MSSLATCALIGLACAVESSHHNGVAGNPLKRVIKGGQLEECSKSDCTVTSMVNASFHWTPQLRAATKPVISEAPAIDNANHSKGAQRACSYSPAHITDFTSYPANLVGRIHFQNPRGYGYRCSGAFVADAAMVLTAGHCCYNHKKLEWNMNWEITLGYDHGGGTAYAAEKATVHNYWKEGDYDYDYCILKMRDPGPSYIDFSVAADPEDFFEDSYVYSYGYAQNYGAGQELYVAYSSMYDYDEWDEAYGHLVAHCNPMIHGSSGGPWILSEQGVIGLNSCHDEDYPSEEKSPYLGEDFLNSCCQAGFCGTGRKSFKASGANSTKQIIFM